MKYKRMAYMTVLVQCRIDRGKNCGFSKVNANIALACYANYMDGSNALSMIVRYIKYFMTTVCYYSKGW